MKQIIIETVAAFISFYCALIFVIGLAGVLDTLKSEKKGEK